MIYKVIYFTRTENSRRIAERIGERLSIELFQLKDNINWKGIVGFIKGGYYSSKNKDVEIEITPELGEYDQIILVSPLWAGGLPPATKKFLKTVPGEKVNLIVVSNGTEIKDTYGIKTQVNITRSKKNEESVIEEFINNIK